VSGHGSARPRQRCGPGRIERVLFPVGQADARRGALRASRLAARAALERADKLDFKPVSSAKWTNIKRSWTGKLRVQIEHDIVRGCTPQMIRWWFENLGRSTTWDGAGFDGPEIPFYHLWHHRDHIAVTPITGSGTGFAVGGRTRIQERFNDYNEKIDVEVVAQRLDDEEFTFTATFLGRKAVRIIHLYSPEPGGSRFYAETQIGLDTPVLGWLINWLLLPHIFSRRTAEHWIRHNIEETGRSEAVIPPLYGHHADAPAFSPKRE
jgi:hypothetical protein